MSKQTPNALKNNDFIDFACFPNPSGPDGAWPDKFPNHEKSRKPLRLQRVSINFVKQVKKVIFVYNVSAYVSSKQSRKSLFLQWFGVCVIRNVNKFIVFTVLRIADQFSIKNQ